MAVKKLPLNNGEAVVTNRKAIENGNDGRNGRNISIWMVQVNQQARHDFTQTAGGRKAVNQTEALLFLLIVLSIIHSKCRIQETIDALLYVYKERTKVLAPCHEDLRHDKLIYTRSRIEHVPTQVHD